MTTRSKLVKIAAPLAGLMLAFAMGRAVEHYRAYDGGECFARDVEWQKLGKGRWKPVATTKAGEMDHGVCVVGELGGDKL